MTTVDMVESSVNGSVDQPGGSHPPLASPPESNLEIEGEAEAEAEAEAVAGAEQPREMVFRLNPFAEEFLPAALRNPPFRRKRNIEAEERRFSLRPDAIRRTIFVSDVGQDVTEELIAGLFSRCGRVIDCRVCGDPHSALRFALVEFDNEHGANVALNFDGTILGFHPLAISLSKTAIAPVNPSLLPQSAPERARCARTVYVNNIDSQITPAEITDLFVTYCGEVSRLKLLNDHANSSNMAFVEFVRVESAGKALSCSGMVLGDSPIRVSPSKTPMWR
ncbi:Ataxin-2 C-terminal region [Musa troglodytarum]|uniref:Ataxin-2 C-terminal region n=1 Tax=Musa troglodytarum TaxID=320322 RepID=A0A9E7E8G5_9LILI|nr:Ataxin-2 C-terminal region [Musa troglodytarum]